MALFAVSFIVARMNFGLKLCSEKGANMIYEPFDWLSVTEKQQLCVQSFLIFRRLKHLQIAYCCTILIFIIVIILL